MHRMTRIVTALCFVAGLASACNRAPDPQDNVNRALKDAQLDKVQVKWDDDAHIAHLRGTVDTPTDKQRAEDVASAAVGTSGRVLNELTIRGVNDSTAADLDGKIKSGLKKAIDGDPTLKDRNIDFDVTNGVVTVKGDVQSAAEKSRVSELVREAPGVKDLANALDIKPKKP
jgi:hyperosmotically inducible periplasmic protein